MHNKINIKNIFLSFFFLSACTLGISMGVLANLPPKFDNGLPANTKIEINFIDSKIGFTPENPKRFKYVVPSKIKQPSSYSYADNNNVLYFWLNQTNICHFENYVGLGKLLVWVWLKGQQIKNQGDSYWRIASRTNNKQCDTTKPYYCSAGVSSLAMNHNENIYSIIYYVP